MPEKQNAGITGEGQVIAHRVTRTRARMQQVRDQLAAGIATPHALAELKKLLNDVIQECQQAIDLGQSHHKDVSSFAQMQQQAQALRQHIDQTQSKFTELRPEG